jgi:hypothetical protein
MPSLPCVGAAWGGKESAGLEMGWGTSAQPNRNLLLEEGEDLMGQPVHRVILVSSKEEKNLRETVLGDGSDGRNASGRVRANFSSLLVPNLE